MPTRSGLSVDLVESDDIDALRADSMTEAELQETIEDFLRSRGWLVYHAVTAQGSEPGLLDIVAVRPPRVLFLELKSSKGRLDTRVRYTRKGRRRLPTQREWFTALSECPGVETYLVSPKDWFSGRVDEIEDCRQPSG